MSSYDWETMMKKDAPMNESDFDNLLEECVPELPPADVVKGVTPWRKAMNRVLWGMALTTITLEFWGLDYILPTIGMLLSLLGFRMLREENQWFKGCFALMLVRVVYFMFYLMLNATIYHGVLDDSSIGMVITVINLGIIFCQIYCFWKGTRKIQEKAGLPPSAKSAIVLLIWYGGMFFLALIQYKGFFIAWGMIIGYICIIRSLYKLSKELDEAGYAIETAPVRVSDRRLVATVLSILAIGIVCGYLFFYSYPMDWKPVVVSEDSEVKEIKEHLISLGFPEDILEDLSDEDIKACEGALRVVVDVKDHPVNDGREVEERGADGIHRYTVYDVEELRITGVGVELPGEREQWKIFHHFQWIVNPGFHGTECIQLWPAYENGREAWAAAGDATGQVLYDKDGQVYAAPYYSLSNETYTSNSIFWGETTSRDVFAEFSMPNEGENHRGYLSYTIKEMRDGSVVDAWINYIHQNSWLQYPALTAKEKRMQNNFAHMGVFKTVQDALQFYPNDEILELY